MSMVQTIWTRDFILLWIAGLCLSVAYYVMLPILPLYLESLDYSETDIGLIIGIFTFSATFIRPVAGFVIDVYGRRYFYIGSLLFFSLFLSLYGFVESLLLLLLVRVLHGFTWGVMTTAGSTVAADLLPQERRGEGMGYYMLTLSIAMAVGPVITLNLLEEGVPYATLFMGGGSIILIGIILAWWINYPRVSQVEKNAPSWKQILEKRVYGLSLTMFLVAITYGVIITFVPIYGKEVEGGGASWFYGIYALFLMAVRPFSGRILDRHGPKILVSVSLLVMGFGYACMIPEASMWSLLLGGALIGIGSGVTLPAMGALVVNRVEADSRGRANATYFIALDIGIAIGSVVFGIIAQWSGMWMVFAGAAILSFLAMLHLLYWVIPRGLHMPLEAISKIGVADRSQRKG